MWLRVSSNYCWVVVNIFDVFGGDVVVAVRCWTIVYLLLGLVRVSSLLECVCVYACDYIVFSRRHLDLPLPSAGGLAFLQGCEATASCMIFVDKSTLSPKKIGKKMWRKSTFRILLLFPDFVFFRCFSRPNMVFSRQYRCTACTAMCSIVYDKSGYELSHSVYVKILILHIMWRLAAGGWRLTAMYTQ